MNDQQTQIILLQAECYRLQKGAQELTATLQELIRIAGASDVQSLAEFIQSNKTQQSVEIDAE